MQRTLSHPVLAWSGLWLLLVPLFVVNAALVGVQIGSIVNGDTGADWTTLVEASRRVWTTDLYGRTDIYGYQWSPVFAMAFAPIAWVGLTVWRMLHAIAIATLPDRRVGLVALALWPFWFDVALGNVLTFVLWFAAWAMVGRRWAVVGLFVVALLVPRPIVLPLVAWLLWRQPWSRPFFAALLLAHTALVAASGWGDEWLARMLSLSDEMTSIFNIGPSRLLGTIWIPVGVVLAAIAFWRGRPGLAGLLLSPYWLPYYLLLPLADQLPQSQFLRRKRTWQATSTVLPALYAAIPMRAMVKPGLSALDSLRNSLPENEM